jgi:hypothetical protein
MKFVHFFSIAFLVLQGWVFGQEIPMIYPQKIYNGKFTIEKNEMGQFGVTDEQGRIVLPFNYNRIVAHSTGIVVFKQNKSTSYERTYSSGFYSKSMKLVLPCNYSSVLPVPDGTLVACQNKDHLFGLVDTNGRILVPFKYNEMYLPSEKLICVKFDTKYGYIDQQDHVMIPFKFQFAKPFSQGLAVATTNQLFGYIDKKGHFEIAEKFTGATDFQGGYAEVFIHDEASILDLKGKILFPFLFRSIEPLGNGLFWFQAPVSYRGKMHGYLKETPISTDLNQALPLVNQGSEVDELGNMYDGNSAETFEGIIDVSGSIIGGEQFNVVHLVVMESTTTLFAVQSQQEIEQHDNWQFALLNQAGKLLTGYQFLEIHRDDITGKIWVEVEVNDQIEQREISTDGRLKAH